jgi:Bacterial PH domain
VPVGGAGWWMANPGVRGTVGATTSAWSAAVLAADQATSGTTLAEPQTFRSVTAIIVWWVWLLFAAGNLVDLAVQGRDHVSLVAAGILVLATGVAYVTARRPRVIAASDALTVRNPLRDHRIPWQNVARVELADLLRIQCRPPGTDPGTNTDADSDSVLGNDPVLGTGPMLDTDPVQGKGKVISAWAVHYSRRRQFTAEQKERRASMRASRTDRPDSGGGISRSFGLSRYDGGASRLPVGDRSLNVRDTSSEAEALRIARLLNDQAAAARATGPAQPTGAAQTRTGPTGAELVTSTWSRDAIAALLIPALLLLIICLI